MMSECAARLGCQLGELVPQVVSTGTRSVADFVARLKGFLPDRGESNDLVSVRLLSVCTRHVLCTINLRSNSTCNT